MFQHKLTPIRLGIVLYGALLVPSLPAAESPTEDVDAFTHLAYIAANSALGTIRFEGIKRVRVPAGTRHTAGARYCAEAAFRGPGGSMFCPSTGTESTAAAYEGTFSFTGQPLASDEQASPRFTFKAYFQPDELAPEVRLAAAARKLERTDAAGYFAVHTSREPLRGVVLDSARSAFCAGAYADRVWIHNERSCQDDVHYTEITEPSAAAIATADAKRSEDRRLSQ
jgi:hypothetical protein